MMMKMITKYWKQILSLLFGVVVAVFWAVPYVSGLCYQEQFQMFLWEEDYFLERILLPGGLADYVSEFLVQFYYMPVAGGIIIALLMVGIQRTIWALMQRMGVEHDFPGYLLSFIPSIALWCVMGDPNVLLSFVVALLGTLLMADTICKGVAKQNVLPAVGYAAGILVLTIAWILLTAQGLQYPMNRIFTGLNYYRYPGVIYSPLFVVMALAVIIPLLGRVKVKKPALLKWQQSKVVVVMSYVLVILATVFGIKGSFDKATYDLIDYDFLVRTEQWNKIIEKAEKKPATTPMGVSCVNLALSQTGQLAERLFEFYQNGGEGLIPIFTRDMTSPVPTSEIFFRLGMVNDAERYMFEAQEAIPNHRKSARMTRRIIECELINGNYKVAAKLLRRLEKTLFYRHWAEQTMALLGNEKAINQHPIYGKLRKYREKKQDFLFSDREMDQMLGFLFLNDKSNKMAYEYLVCYELLQRDLAKFMQYYPLGRFVGYDHIPRSFQEILNGTNGDSGTMSNAWHYMYNQK